MINRLCTNCGGKGFVWIKTKWKSKPNEIQYDEGKLCRVCKGTGTIPNPYIGHILIFFVILIVIVFCIYTLIK